MSVIIHKSELVRRALAYVDQERNDRPDARLSQLLDEAGMRFNLSPKDAEALKHIFEVERCRQTADK